MNPELINKFRKPVLITVGIIAAYALIGFVILPAILKNQLPKIVEEETGRKTTLDKVEFNPFSLEFSLLGFSIQEKDPQTFVSFDKFFVNVQVWSSIKEFALVLDEVSLEGPYARFEMLPDGQYNFSDILNGADDEEEIEEEKDEEEGIFPLIINHINLVQGELETVDSLHSKPDSTLIQDLHLHLQHFSTLLNDQSNLGFSLALNTGGVLDWQGEVGVNPLFSNGKIKIEGLKFARIWKQFLQDKVEFKWEEGTQLISFDYAFSYADDEPSFQLTKGRLLTEGLKFTPKESAEKLIDIPYFLVDDIHFDLNKQSINIAKIESREVDVDAWYNQAGELNMQTAFAAQVDESEAEAEAEVTDTEQSEAQTDNADAMPWEINIKDIAFTGSKLNFSDKRKQQHALINLAALDIGLKNYHLLAGESTQMTANQGYINLDDLMLKTNRDPKLFHIPNFQINEVDFNLLDQKLNIKSVSSRDVFIKAWLEKNGEINYQGLFASTGEVNETNDVEEQKDPQAVDKPWEVNIQDIAFNSSKINFSDKSKVQPIFINITALDIGIKDYDVLAGNVLQMTGVQGYLKLNGFELKTEQDPNLVRVPNLQVSELGFNFQEKNLSIKSINSRDAVIKAWLAKNGEINYQTLFAPSGPEPAQQTPVTENNATDEKPWQLALGEFRIDNYALEFKDQSTKKPVLLNLSELNFSINNFNNKKGTKLPLSFSTLVNKKGKIKMTGQSILEPFSSNLDLAISNIGISTFQPYVNESVRLSIISGRFNTQGKLAISLPEDSDLKLSYKGGVNIKGLHTRDQILKQDFLKWQQLKLSGIDFNLQPGKLKIKAVKLDKPYAKVTIKKDKTTNINDVIIEADKPQKKATKKVAKKSAPFVYNVAKVTITGGESDFSDYSLILPFVVKLNDLDGAISNISSYSKAKTKLNLKGKTFDLSPVDIKGEFNANLDDLDISLHYKSLPLPFLSPYMVEFAGNKIEKGKLSLDLMYKVKEGQLSATNNVMIDQLELGDKVESPNAVDLPLGLAITLLKDKDGKININMPLQGSMDDPEFSIGPVLLDTFINLITKAVTSPFTAIGSFLGSDEDFSVVTFQAGNAELSAEEIVKLDGLSGALQQKPDLSLEIKGMAYTNQDWPAMKEQALLDELKQMRSDELKEDGEMKLPEYIELSDDEYQRLLADLFIQKFPELGERSLFGTPQLIHEDMGEFSTVASNMLQGLIQPNNDKLLILSLTRARNIARYMNAKGTIDHARMFILDGKIEAEAENNQLNTSLSLKM